MTEMIEASRSFPDACYSQLNLFLIKRNLYDAFWQSESMILRAFSGRRLTKVGF